VQRLESAFSDAEREMVKTHVALAIGRRTPTGIILEISRVQINTTYYI